jgi:ABC-type phosphate transport system substrate-binding protein
MIKSKRIIVYIVIFVLIASLSIEVFTRASNLPFQSGLLVNSSTLTLAGSDEVGTIATEEASQFPSYWNNLVAANPNWDASSCTLPIEISTLGSGTAIPALLSGAADIADLSRPPENSSAEWLNPSLDSMQTWAVGIDSVVIVLSPDMSWFPRNLTTAQVADLFADANPTANQNQGVTGNTGSEPLFATWDDFFNTENIPTSGINPYYLGESINRVIISPTSGVFDTFNNYFAVPNGYQFEYNNSVGTVVGAENMAPYTYCQENINVLETLSQQTSSIGFVSFGFFQIYGAVMGIFGLNISYNIAQPYSTGTNNQNSLTSYVRPAVWGPYVKPTKDNILNAYMNMPTSESYFAWTFLWAVTPSTIPSSGPLLETGVWISYMRAQNTTQGSTSDFVNDQGYIQMNLADYTGGHDMDSNLAPYTPLTGQTQETPNGQVGSADFFYFVNAYIQYYSQNSYNPYADILATGHVNSADFFAFVNQYIAYFTTYNPT